MIGTRLDFSTYSAADTLIAIVVIAILAPTLAYGLCRLMHKLVCKLYPTVSNKAESAKATQPVDPITDPAKDAKLELESLIQQIDDELIRRQIVDLEACISRIRRMLSDPNLKCTSRNIKILQDAIDSMRELINLKYERFISDQPKNTDVDSVKHETKTSCQPKEA